MMAQGNKQQAGFSLMELTVALVVLIIVLTAIFSIVANVQRSYRDQIGSTQAQANMRRVLEFIARDLATAGANGVGGVAAGANATSVHVQADLGQPPYNEYSGLDPTPDGAANQRDEDITYTYYPASPTRPTGQIVRLDAFDPDYGGERLIADGIKNFTIEYRNDAGDLLAVPLSAADAPNVAKITVTVEAIYGRQRTITGFRELTYRVNTEVLILNNQANLNRF